jgi:hypothetical protein
MSAALGPDGIASFQQPTDVRPRCAFSSTGRRPHDHDVLVDVLVASVSEKVRSATDKVSEADHEHEEQRGGIRLGMWLNDSNDIPRETVKCLRLETRGPLSNVGPCLWRRVDNIAACAAPFE